MDKYIGPFLVAFLLTEFLIILAILGGKWVNFKARKGERHLHKTRNFRLGGVVMILAFNLAILLNKDLVLTPEFYGMMAASVGVMLFGVWDDLKEIYWKIQLFFQFGVALIVFIAGIRIYYVTNPLTGGILSLDTGWGVLISVFLVVFWITLVMNAMNWLDGIDGLSGGVAFIVSLTIFILSLRPEVNQPPVAIVSAILCGTILGFLIFNFNPSRILAGTSGSMFMGFVLAVLAIFAGTKIATAVLVMAVPLIDFLWVILERLRKGQSIFKPDTAHLHHKLLELGWSQRKINFLFYIVTIIVAGVALNTRFIGKSVALMVIGVIMLVILMALNRQLEHKKSEEYLLSKK